MSCDPRGLDKYGRTLAVCFVDGRDINAEMVRQGYAWAFVKYSQSYVKEEALARAEGLGIWQGESQPAWEYRAKRWAAAEPTAPEGCAIKGNVTKNGKIYHMPWSPWYAQHQDRAGQGQALVLLGGRGAGGGLAAGEGALSAYAERRRSGRCCWA